MAPPPQKQKVLAVLSCRRCRTLLHVKLLLLVLTLVSYNINECLSQYLIEYLPGFPGKLPFKFETGYIGLGEKEEVQLFYYFIESESTNPEDDPLMLWSSGGPGCSSLYALTYENGPFMFDYTKSSGNIPALILNEYSWTKFANILFLDQPAPGTGFSYANSSKPYYLNDTSSAAHAHEFLRKWLLSHTKYVECPLYISGDSYSGIILPLLVSEVYKGIEEGTKPLMNMKGYILGNPVTDQFADVNERILFAHRMGLLSDELYQSAKVNCHGNYKDVDPENFLCLNDLQRISQCLEKIYEPNILEPACDEELGKEKQDILSWRWHIPASTNQEIPTSSNFLQLVAPMTKSICRNTLYNAMHTWANDKSVQKALHVREGTITEWTTGADESMAFTHNVQTVVPYHQDFTHKTCRALIYSGDHDLLIPHTGTEKWIDSLKVPLLSDWRPWFVQGQVAGYTMTYGHGDYELTYATVKAAGHTAPEFKPSECFAMIGRWFDGEPL